MSSFPRELHQWQRVRTAGVGVCRGVDYWSKVCACCVLTEMWATHNCADTGLVVLADMEQNCIY